MVSSNFETNINFGRENDFTGNNVITGSTIEGPVYQTIIAADETFKVSGKSPYLGLAAYTREASHLYAGRENRVAETVKIVTEPGAQPNLLFVIGASGSGKSSFIQAGVLAALEQAYSNYLVRSVIITPSTYPRSKIQRDVLQAWSIEYQASWAINDCLQALAKHTAPSTINLIVIDQFEEVWTQSNPEQSRELLAALQTLPSFEEGRTQIIVTLRADFVYKLYSHQMLYDFATKPPVVELRPMSSADIRRAIEHPLQIQYPGKHWEPLLLKDLARVAADQIDALPLLQVMLDQQWQTGKLWLDAPKDFDRAISDHADAIYDTYSAAQQTQIMRLLTELVKVGDEPRQDVRQRRSVAAVCNDNAECEKLIADLIKARLLSSDQEMRGEQSVPVVTIIHESLLTNWSLLRESIKKERDTLIYRKRLEDLFNDWQKADQSQEHLLRDAYLAQARQLVDKNDSIFRDNKALLLFFNTSVAQAERDLAQQLDQAKVLADEQRQRADAEQKIADEQRQRANAEQKIAEEQRGRLAQTTKAKRRLWLALATLSAFIITLLILGIRPFQNWQWRKEALKLSQTQDVVASIGKASFTDPVTMKEFQYSIPDFALDGHLVSNRQYCLCHKADGCTSLPEYDNGDACSTVSINQPVHSITLKQANEFCLWINRRLPTELEWEWAYQTNPNLFHNDPEDFYTWTISPDLAYDAEDYTSQVWPNLKPDVSVITRVARPSNSLLNFKSRRADLPNASPTYIGFRCITDKK